ncbi:hypothetical protein [Maritimibacter fusiformis]|uniref:Lipoprotein n=1 Tax=Maritimibacter fusiformis TaxID=2603819 RepID=A0A5D0RN66_9RHOB|nr:hypothetical protein [Maritimibacter fusiformis]TYB82131.1 hypothetical protein FVF75_05200 [Maritimibacter fusiformis]
MTIAKAVSFTALLALAACAGAEINQPPVQYTATKPLNEISTTTFTTRTFTRVDGKRAEVSGVSCTFQGDGFKSSFTTPAVVIAPNMHMRTPAASVTCNYNGQSKTRVLMPFNQTLAEINSGAMSIGAGAGIVGVLVGGAVAAAQASGRDASQDVYAYPDAVIEFPG